MSSRELALEDEIRRLKDHIEKVTAAYMDQVKWGTKITLERPPLPAMPASVRELVDRAKGAAVLLWHQGNDGPSQDLREAAAAVEAHYAGGA